MRLDGFGLFVNDIQIIDMILRNLKSYMLKSLMEKSGLSKYIQTVSTFENPLTKVQKYVK